MYIYKHRADYTILQLKSNVTNGPLSHSRSHIHKFGVTKPFNNLCILEPLNKGLCLVPCREVVLFLEVPNEWMETIHREAVSFVERSNI